MPDNRVSIQLTEAELTAVQTALETINTTLHTHLVTLSAADRSGLAKMSEKTLPFVQKTLDYAQSHPQFVPAYVKTADLKIDLEAVQTLTRLLNPMVHLTQQLGDSVMLSGSEAFTAALAYYNSVKQAAKMNVPVAQAIYDDLSTRFEKGRSTKKTVPST